MERTAGSGTGGVTLGKYLASIRTARKLTLRQVEEATNKEVSNAYLSQIETEKIKKPSPNILHALAELYAIDYENLMQMAGYITASERSGTKAAETSGDSNPDVSTGGIGSSGGIIASLPPPPSRYWMSSRR